MFLLTNKTSLITGAGSGIGAAIAETFSRAGATVLVADRDDTSGKAVVSRILAAGGRAEFIPLDVTNDVQISALVSRVRSLDILVNNAGVGHVGSILETEPADLDRLYAVNVRGMFSVTRAVLPSMIARGQGSVINIASVGGIVAIRDRCAYSTTKFAVVGLTKSLALDLSSSGVRFNAICPCRVETTFVEARLAEYPDPVAARRDMESTQLAGRMARPDEIASAALYLAADESAMVTGSALMIDSGWSAGK